MRRIYLGVLTVLLSLSVASAKDEDGEKLYKRCAACHLSSGAGVPGAYPPIHERLGPLAQSDAGRDYLVWVVQAGLAGPMTVGGIAYRGMMPAQGPALKAGGIASVLNYVMEELNGLKNSPDWTPFTPQEVKTILDKKPRLRAHEVMKRRPEALREKD
tara:strand:+ start:187 stop:660 length:474 start_codon:yes stop_codon:yes gene_type:complete